MNEQDRYRGRGSQQDPTEGRNSSWRRDDESRRDDDWRRDDESSLQGRGSFPRAGSVNENEWQRDYGARTGRTQAGWGEQSNMGSRGEGGGHRRQEPWRGQEHGWQGHEQGYQGQEHRGQIGQEHGSGPSFMRGTDTRREDWGPREQDRDFRGGSSGYGRARDYRQEWSGGGGHTGYNADRERDQWSGGSRGMGGSGMGGSGMGGSQGSMMGSSYGAGGSYGGGSYGGGSYGSGSSNRSGNVRSRSDADFNARAQAFGFSGRGPKGYTRSDERIREDVSERLSEHDEIDASDIEVTVKDRVVTLTGTVENRRMKHMAEDLAEMVSGVDDVENRITVRKAFLKDMADRLMGTDQPEQHYAHSGTKNSSTTGSSTTGSSTTGSSTTGSSTSTESTTGLGSASAPRTTPMANGRT